MKRWYWCLVLVVSAAFAALAAPARAMPSPAPSPEPSAREPLGEAWWTGPLLAPSAGTLPHGHMLIEPYLFDVMQYGNYEANGKLVSTQRTNSFGSLTYIIYGATDRFGVGVIPTFGYTAVSGGLSASGIGVGDWAVLAQYRLAQYHPGSWVPTTSIDVQQTFPTGRYDNLGARPSNGQGGGVYSTKVSLYTQTYFWLATGRILRTRLNVSEIFSGSGAVNGVSVYGTPEGFNGRVYPGNSLVVDAAAEYSVTQRWVLAGDFVYTYAGDTRLTAANVSSDLGQSRTYAIAPAIEYNWSSNVGIIAGVRLFPSGVNATASVTPAIAVNIVR